MCLLRKGGHHRLEFVVVTDEFVKKSSLFRPPFWRTLIPGKAVHYTMVNPCEFTLPRIHLKTESRSRCKVGSSSFSCVPGPMWIIKWLPAIQMRVYQVFRQTEAYLSLEEISRSQRWRPQHLRFYFEMLSQAAHPEYSHRSPRGAPRW